MRADAPVTPLSGIRPRRPIHCSVCGRLLGAWYLLGVTHYPYLVQCSSQCERLLDFARGRDHVPRGWREIPQQWRSALLAAALLETKAR